MKKSCYANVIYTFEKLKSGLFQEPEESHEFIVVLTGVRNDARLDEQNVVAKVVVEPSDNVRGLIQFTKNSR